MGHIKQIIHIILFINNGCLFHLDHTGFTFKLTQLHFLNILFIYINFRFIKYKIHE